ncbi:MAG: RluA family pseudouridine synthase [Oscillospiraceae bacterium]|jgi:23S rRNA pseudouridine1911/1915/1917 synthase
MRTITYTVEERYGGCSVSAYLKNCHGYSRRALSRLKQGRGSLAVNGTPVVQLVATRLQPGDVLTVLLENASPRFVPNPALMAPVLYEDADVVVFDKPPGMPVHPSHRHREDTLANLFAARYGEKGMGYSFHPINRLDKDTSGLCVVAKHPVAAAALSGAVEKRYYAVAEGIVSPPEGLINLPIARAGESIILRKVDSAGQTAVTRYATLRTGNRHTLLEIRLETGRTHQIRVHFSHLGFPLAGDTLYGGHTEFVRRQALHCGVVQFRQPLTGEPVLVQAPLPPDLLHILNE